ncbi:hypothetical protein OsI_11756 [Oryza sativa Indica Group]|uniref:Uncharacterized protein n=1 Tax=Oryza sativa subsp. indica TaxID=39946 RepID=A2XH82_ORYSI|nr:hypothetical protein OsI_11756 [Oryza sativa Indica Group]
MAVATSGERNVAEDLGFPVWEVVEGIGGRRKVVVKGGAREDAGRARLAGVSFPASRTDDKTGWQHNRAMEVAEWGWECE